MPEEGRKKITQKNVNKAIMQIAQDMLVEHIKGITMITHGLDDQNKMEMHTIRCRYKALREALMRFEKYCELEPEVQYIIENCDNKPLD